MNLFPHFEIRIEWKVVISRARTFKAYHNHMLDSIEAGRIIGEQEIVAAEMIWTYHLTPHGSIYMLALLLLVAAAFVLAVADDTTALAGLGILAMG